MDIFSAVIKQQREKEIKEIKQLRLGELINKLKIIIEDLKKENKNLEDIDIYYDFEYLFPLHFDSYRGYYDELALDFYNHKEDINKQPLNILQFLKLCEETVGKTFYGYKGSEYIMNENTPIWIANYGNTGSTALIDAYNNSYEIILITKWIGEK